MRNSFSFSHEAKAGASVDVDVDVDAGAESSLSKPDLPVSSSVRSRRWQENTRDQGFTLGKSYDHTIKGLNNAKKSQSKHSSTSLTRCAMRQTRRGTSFQTRLGILSKGLLPLTGSNRTNFAKDNFCLLKSKVSCRCLFFFGQSRHFEFRAFWRIMTVGPKLWVTAPHVHA